MHASERSLLLETSKDRSTSNLSVLFSIICIIDVFGVFPVVALPRAIIDCGYYGILVIGVVCSTQIYTAVLLGRCWVIANEVDSSIHRKNRYPYSALAELTYGKTLSNFVSFLLDVTVFGGGIPNLIVASQNLQLLGLRLTEDTFDVSSCYWIIILGTILCPILWLGSPKNMKLLCSISMGIVVAVFLLIAGCLIFSPVQQVDNVSVDPQTRPFWELILAAYGIISFQYDIHPSILTIQVDMKDKTKLPLAILGGFIASLGMFVIITTIAAIRFGSDIKPSILETLPTTIPLHFAAFFVALQLCLSSAVSNSALYQHMEDCMSISRGFNHRRCVLRTTLTLLAILIAESVPRFDLVMSLIGGTLTGPLVFVLPPLFYIKLLGLQKKQEKQLAMESFSQIVYKESSCLEYDSTNGILKYMQSEFKKDVEGVSYNELWRVNEVFLCVVIIICSIVGTGVTTYVNVKSAITFANFSRPCIYNVSNALINF